MSQENKDALMLRPRQELRVLSRKKGEEQFTIVKLLLSNKETNRCDSSNPEVSPVVWDAFRTNIL